MSYAVTTVAPDGIVMAADSAASILTMVDIKNLLGGNLEAAIKNNLGGKMKYGPNDVIDSRIISRSSPKLCVMKDNNIAIANCNESKTRNTGESIIPYLEYFTRKNYYDNPRACAEGLLNFFQGIDPSMGAVFHVCGYNPEGKIPVPEFWYVNVAGNKAEKIAGHMQYGICFCGANGYFSQYKAEIDKNLIHLTLQDAVDITIFAVEMSMKLERFIKMTEHIAPPIDLLVITQKGVEWIQNKTLKVQGGEYVNIR